MSTPMTIPPDNNPFSHAQVTSGVPDDDEEFGRGFTTTFAFIEPQPIIVGADGFPEAVDAEPDEETVQRILARLKR